MPGSLSEVLTNKSFLICVAVTLICVVPSICGCWLRIRRHEIDSQLKDSMVARGMSADEIVRVLEAGRRTPNQAPRSSDFVVEFERKPDGDASRAPVAS